MDLFAAYGVEIRPAFDERAESNLEFCGVIGFTGKDLRGSLLLACSREPLTVAGDAILRDWLAELANQMLGRIKNKLMTLGTVIYCSTPIILRGQHLAPLADQPKPQLFHANGGIVSVWFDVDIDGDLQLAGTPDTSATVGEGATLLF